MAYAQSFDRLITIMDELRERCPWDKKQTIQTLRQLTLEEVYELTDSITEENWQGLKEELGDLLLHIIFYSRIGREQEQFTIDDVIEGVCNKLVARHPHIYSHVQADTDEQVKQNWEKIKLKEGKKSVLGGLPKALPALMKALRLQEKAKQVGFEWDYTEQVQAKVDEEISELYEAVQANDQREMEAEFGDVLFALINYARFINVDPEQALEKTNIKFKTRFERMEALAAERDTWLHDMNLEQMDALWNEAKKEGL